jgi:hypothetical protein
MRTNICKKIKIKERERDIIKLIYLHFLYRHSYFFSHFQSEGKQINFKDLINYYNTLHKSKNRIVMV